MANKIWITPYHTWRYQTEAAIHTYTKRHVMNIKKELWVITSDKHMLLATDNLLKEYGITTEDSCRGKVTGIIVHLSKEGSSCHSQHEWAGRLKFNLPVSWNSLISHLESWKKEQEEESEPVIQGHKIKIEGNGLSIGCMHITEHELKAYVTVSTHKVSQDDHVDGSAYLVDGNHISHKQVLEVSNWYYKQKEKK
jgi:hypothetical protein